VENEVIGISRDARRIHVKELRTGRVYEEAYDALVLSPGAVPVRPPLPGIELPGIFTLRTIPDSRKIRDWVEARQSQRAVVVGGGFIGLEMAENLTARGLEVTIIEMADQLMPPLDPEMADFVRRRLVTHAAHAHLGDGVAGFEPRDGALAVRTKAGAVFPADIVVLAIGVRPDTELARRAGLEIGATGGIRVDDRMRTSDPNIWAVGDAIEVRDFVTGQPCLVPLAGPANRQGRIAADVICGRDSRFRGVQATAVCGFFGMTVAITGATEKSLPLQCMRDLDCVLDGRPALDVIHCIHSHDDGEPGAKFFPHRGDHFSAESKPVFERAAVFVFATVTVRRQELVDQIAVAEGNFQRIEAGLTDTAGGITESSNRLNDSLFGQRAGNQPVCGAEHLRSRYQISLGDQFWIRRPAGVGDVRHDSARRSVDTFHQPAKSTDEPVLVYPQLSGELAAVELHVQRLRGNEPCSPLGLELVESDVPIGDLAFLGAVSQLDCGPTTLLGRVSPPNRNGSNKGSWWIRQHSSNTASNSCTRRTA